mmetsp:Transcript_52579/g.83738  ORF Transcript_52579/g.83738 Transcript_52579/m.83738 type:complete len:750 (-) Transcript_52579:96-2345(-)
MVFLVEDFVNLPSDQIANIWLAAHTQKLAKKDIKKTKLGEACDQLHSDKTKKPMQLRHYAQCLMGIAWIHCEQVKILHSDCTEAFSKARLILVRKRKVDLDPAQERGRDITLPEHRHNHNLNLPANEQPDLLQDIDLNDTNYSQLLLRGDDENISDTASLLESHSGRGEHLALDHEITMQQNNYTSPSRTRAGRVAVTDRRSSFGGISSLLESGEYDLEIKFDDDEDEEPLDESKAQRSQNTDNVAFDEDETDDENRSVERGRGAATTTNHNTALFNTTHDHISDIGSVNAQAVAIDLDDTHSRVSLEKEKRLDDLGSVHSAGSLQDNVPMIDAQAMEIDDHSIDDQQPLHVEFNLDAQSVTGSVSTAILDGKEAEDERATPPPSPGAREKRARSQRGRVDEDESEQVQQDADGEAQRKKKKKKKDTDSDTDSDSDSSDSSESGSDSDSSSKSKSSSSESDSESDSDSDSSSGSDSTDSEEEEKSGGRRKKKGKKKKGKEKKIEFEEMSEWKEADEQKWEVEEIRIKKEVSATKKFKFIIEELRDNTAYCVRIRGKNSSGWGAYTVPLKVQTPKMSILSKILKSKEFGYFSKILPKKLKNKRFKLIFRASKDGFAASQFHAKCDNKGPTITIVQSTANHVFGGYANVAWSTASSNYVNDPKAWIFLLRSTRGNVPQKWNVTNAGNAVYHNISYGPTFGGGFDFYLCNNCNTTNSSYSNLGHSYAAPKDQNMLAGSYNFMVKEFEVFQVK